MRIRFAPLAVLLLIAGAPAGGLAQGINQGLGGDGGGVGVGPNGAGFTGAMGDPVWLAENPTMGAAPFSYYPHAVPAGPAVVPTPPGAYAPAPGAPPFEYYYTPPGR